MSVQVAVTPLQRFARENGIKLAEAKAVQRLADQIYEAGEDYSNNASDINERRLERLQVKFAALIKPLGFDDYDMPGLWPVLIKKGVQIYLPE